MNLKGTVLLTVEVEEMTGKKKKMTVLECVLKIVTVWHAVN